jgi:microcystin degradation protein MlrC
MVAEHATDGEGYLLQQLRDIVGPEVPIGVTLDLHANVSDLMARHADVIVSYRTYPHIDQREVAVECAGLIARILEGEIRTACHVRRPPMLTGLDHGRTTAPGPMREALKLASEVSVEPAVFSTSVLAGFSPADTADAGPSVVVVAQRENQQAQHAGDRIIEHIWNTRKTETVALASAEQAIATARDKGKPGTPVVIADFADNPGGGGYGDSNALLRALIDSGLQHVLFGALYDPDSAAACHQAKGGESIALEIGGKIDPAFGPPISANAKIEALTNGQFHLAGPMQAGMPIDMGLSAMVLVNGVHIVLGSRRFQNFDRMYFESFGADLNKAAVIAVKSSQHFRAAYGESAAEIVVVDDGNGITTESLTGRNYTAVRRPVYPLDF